MMWEGGDRIIRHVPPPPPKDKDNFKYLGEDVWVYTRIDPSGKIKRMQRFHMMELKGIRGYELVFVDGTGFRPMVEPPKELLDDYINYRGCYEEPY